LKSRFPLASALGGASNEVSLQCTSTQSEEAPITVQAAACETKEPPTPTPSISDVPVGAEADIERAQEVLRHLEAAEKLLPDSAIASGGLADAVDKANMHLTAARTQVKRIASLLLAASG
jgi:hypothetical protein